MNGPSARVLPGGRLHLWHGPIDLVIDAEGPGKAAALAAAKRRFATILEELVDELPLLRAEVSDRRPAGATARRMHSAVLPHSPVFITPMAAVAGSVADEVLSAMRDAGDLARAYVNNGGDIAIYLTQGQTYVAAMAAADGTGTGRIIIPAQSGIGGIATSGRRGRSHSFGIADSATVLARCAADADAAATLIANAVDLPAHPSIRRVPAREVLPDSDLGDRPVTEAVGPLSDREIGNALDRGLLAARKMIARGLVDAAHLTLGRQSRTTGHPALPEHAHA